MRRPATIWAGAALLLVLALPCAVAAANDEEDFYRGKTISLIIPIGPGGAYDTYGRLVARYLGKRIPGNPLIVPRNMPGAGGTIASNHVYNLAPQDGTTLTMITSSFAMEQLFDNPQIRYDARRFIAIGRLLDTTSVILLPGTPRRSRPWKTCARGRAPSASRGSMSIPGRAHARSHGPGFTRHADAAHPQATRRRATM